MIKKNKKAVIALFSCSFLIGCSFTPPKETNHPKFLNELIIEKQTEQIAKIRLNWYQDFNDPQLNQLIEEGLQNNLDLEQARKNIDIAAEQIKIANAGLRPSVTGFASGGGDYSKIGGESGSHSQFVSAIPYLSYHFDFWDKYKSIKTEAIDYKLANDALLAQTRLSIVSAIISSYFNYKNANDNIHILDRLIADQVNQNRVIRIQVKRGLLNQSILYQSKGSVSSLKLDQVQAKNRRSLAKNQLAILLAKPPQSLDALLTPKAKPIQALDHPDYIPLHLLSQRPDIIASKWMVEAKSEGITQKRATYYPDINLSAFGVLQKLFSTTPDQLILSSTSIAMSLPLYDAGVRDANFNIANTEYDQAIINYNQQLLSAARQASDAISNLNSAIQEKQLAKSSSDNYYQAYQIEKKRFSRGVSTYTEMNTARIQWNQQLINLQNSRNKVLQSQLELIIALGGSYQDETQPEK